jgi:VanZ family protein
VTPDAPSPQARRILRLAAIGYALFVAYGCLIPLRFYPIPWEVSLERYEHILRLVPGRFSRSDWLANVLLFVPITFFWMAALWPGRRPLAASLRAALVWAAAVLFQMALEFGQVFVPGRSVSLQDVIAAMQGAAVGIVLWATAGGRVLSHVELWDERRGAEGLASWALAPYAMALILFNLLPLDMTFSPGKLLAKWERGMVFLVPFQGGAIPPPERTLAVAGHAAQWLPVAMLWVLAGRGGRRAAWLVAIVLATGVELGQLCVMSRVSDATDLVSAALGAALGALLGGWLEPRLPRALGGSTRAAPQGRREHNQPIRPPRP